MQILLPYCRSIPENCFYQDFHRGVTEALHELGHEPIPFSFAAPGQSSQEEADALYRQLESGNLDAVLDLACWGYGLSHIAVLRNGEKQTIFDAFDVAYAGMLFDHPYNQPINGIRARKSYVTYPDLGHPEQARYAFPDLRLHREIFAPPGIRPDNDRSAENWSDRDIDVLYVGNLAPDALKRFWLNPPAKGQKHPFEPGICNAIVNAALADPDRSLSLSVDAAIALLRTLPRGFDFNAYLRAAEWFLRATFRRDAVVALARSGVRMRVIGRGWDSIALPANVELGAGTDYEGFFRLAGRAKICLDASTYLDGANDRVFTYALNRAVCFTNAAGYLRRAFGEENGMRFYSMRNLSELGEQVNMLLARPDALREAGERARQTVLASHTWRHRVGDILSAMPC